MKRQKTKPFDFPAPQQGPSIQLESVSEDGVDFTAPLELREADSLGPMIPAEDLTPDAGKTSFELPSLSSVDDGGPSPQVEPLAIRSPSALPYYMVALFVSALVLLAPVVFAWSYQRDVTPFRNDVFALGVIALLALGPAALVWLTAFVLHQTARLTAETRRTEALTHQLAAPTTIAARSAETAIGDVRREIELATAAATAARTELLSLREVLAAESQRLIEATEGSSRTAATLTRELSGEREKMNVLAASLDAQAADVSDAITRHARMVTEASDLAETQLREAEAALTARAADLAAAAGEASDASRVASEDLSRQVARLEVAGQGVGDQARLLEEGLTGQRAALVTVAHGLRADQEAFAAEAETQLARLNEMVAHAREGAGELGDHASRGAEALSQLLTRTGSQLADIVEAATHERDLLSASAAQSLGAISEIASRERQGLQDQAQLSVDEMLKVAEQARHRIEAHLAAVARERDLISAAATQSLSAVTEVAGREQEDLERRAKGTMETLIASADDARRAMEAQAEAAREKVDHLAEAAFASGQKAEALFESRLSEARGLIQQSANLVDEAGAATVARLGQGVDSARATLAELEGLLTDVDARIARLPADAQARAETVRASIERGMEDLMASARRAAEETQTIDAAFQDRVRRNYDMLSEAVRLMGVVAGSAGGVSLRAASAPPPLQQSLAQESARTPAPPPVAPVAPPAERRPYARPEPSPAAEAEARSTGDAGLRPRLRLTPTASDEEFKTVFDAAGGREAARRDPPAPREAGEPAAGPTSSDGWTWRELLSSMDDEAPIDEAGLADLVLGEMDGMGIDAGALLPRARVEEIAGATHAGEVEAARRAVHRLAPAAIRRLSRRMMADRPFRAQSEHFVRRYRGLLDGADRTVTSALLGSDQGRAYLLFDAAVAEAL
jgi:hypothetical protein